VCGAATENARRANSVRVLAADSSGASEDRRGRTGTARHGVHVVTGRRQAVVAVGGRSWDPDPQRRPVALVVICQGGGGPTATQTPLVFGSP